MMNYVYALMCKKTLYDNPIMGEPVECYELIEVYAERRMAEKEAEQCNKFGEGFFVKTLPIN